MVAIRWTERAVGDLKHIASYIAQDSPKYAQLTVKALRLKAKSLKEHPLLGRVVPELNRDDIREVLQGTYRIIYWVENENTVHILTVHHSAQIIRGNVLFI